MLPHVLALLLLTASAWASVWQTNFVFDRLMPSVGLKEIALHDISLDADHGDTFSGFVEFHLEKGTLSDLSRRVRRDGGCRFRSSILKRERICCNFSLRGLVAKYNLEAIEDGRSQRAVAEALITHGNLYTCVETNKTGCTQSTTFHSFSVTARAKLKPLAGSIDFPDVVIRQFEKKVVPLVEIETARALNSTYKEALERKVAHLTRDDFVG